MPDNIEDDIVELVDELADELDPERIERSAIRLGISPEELLDRVVVEVKARLGLT